MKKQKFIRLFKIFPSIHWKVGSICMFFILIVACNDFLDIAPEDNLDLRDLVYDDQGLESLIVGAYYLLGSPELLGGEVLRNAELLAATEELLYQGRSSETRDIYSKTMKAPNRDVRIFWEVSYKVINTVNLILAQTPILLEQNRDQIAGQANFIRAITYFELVRFFGLPYEPGKSVIPGVPLIIEPIPFEGNVDLPASTTVEIVYALIIQDLLVAESLLSSPDQLNEDWRINKITAQALLARVYLQMHDFENALNYAHKVISDGHYELVEDYLEVFNRKIISREDIFSIQIPSVNALNTAFFNNIKLKKSYRDSLYIDPNDKRLQLFFCPESDSSYCYSNKWLSDDANISVIRLAEMYLIRAECNEMLGTEVGNTPLEDINLLRERSDAVPFESINADMIYEERIRELAFEGFRIHDIKRLKKSVGDLPYDDPKLVFPIPENEINLNPNLFQNPGYE